MYNKVTCYMPAILLKMNYFTSIFQKLCRNYDVSFFFGLLFGNTYFKEHLLLKGFH